MIYLPSYFAVWADTKRWGCDSRLRPHLLVRRCQCLLLYAYFVGVNDEGFAVILGHDIQDNAGDNEQKTSDDQHHRADQRGEVGDHAGLGACVCTVKSSTYM